MGVYFDGARGEYWEITVDLGQPMHFREIELDLDTSGAMTLDVALELPGMDLVSHFSSTVNTETTTTGRRPWNQRTAGNLKGQLLKLRLSGSAVVRMWGAKIYARPLNAAGGWRWIPLPVPETPVDWMTAKLPIRETAIGWTWIDFPVDAAG
jgi:hypothetical protein